MSQTTRTSSSGTRVLHNTLEQVLTDYFGAPRAIVGLVRRSSAYRSSFALEELDVCLDDGTAIELFFKDLGFQGLLADARRAKPEFLYNPRREIAVYRSILAPSRLGTAICYGAIADDRYGRYWLFLERVHGQELYQVGDFTVWQQVARWLATVHAHFSREASLASRAERACLLRYDSRFYRRWLHRAQFFWRRAQTPPLSTARSSLERLAGRYQRVIGGLSTLPTTFLHGEFYPSNILIQTTADVLRVCPVDWEMAAVGPYLIDLAALIAGSWTREQKESLALTYYAALTSAGGDWQPSPAEFLAALDYCRLHLAVQWLGWSLDWSPPPQHAQNWLGEALELAEKLGLLDGVENAPTIGPCEP